MVPDPYAPLLELLLQAGTVPNSDVKLPKSSATLYSCAADLRIAWGVRKAAADSLLECLDDRSR